MTKEEKSIYNKQYRLKNKQLVTNLQKKWREQHKEEIKNYNKKYKHKFRDKLAKQKCVWLKVNPEKLQRVKANSRVRYTRWIKIKRQDPIFRAVENLKHRIRTVIIRQYKQNSSLELFGCSVIEIRIYLESLFKEGMTWYNYGKWHIDHIIPCSSFDLTKVEEQEKCFHYTNLQPLWAIDNLRKSNKIL